MDDQERVALRAKIQGRLNRIIASGSPASEVFEAALTVAIAGMVGQHGAMKTANSLLSTGAGLTHLAAQAEADQSAARH